MWQGWGDRARVKQWEGIHCERHGGSGNRIKNNPGIKGWSEDRGSLGYDLSCGR